jgi:DNA-binding transcriptional ArsR family regulator
MSIEAVAWALSLDLPNAGQKLTLIAVCNFADEDGKAWPSQARLSRDTSQSERSVRSHLSALEKAGIIKRQKRKKQDGSYNSDMLFIQRQYSPAANSANGKKQHSPAEKVAAKPSIDITNVISEPSVDHFENDFWPICPKKVGKGQARKAFKAALKKTDLQSILDGMRRYAKSVEHSEAQFIAHPATWLNGERWNDEYTTSDQNRKQHGSGQGSSILNAAARFRARRAVGS